MDASDRQRLIRLVHVAKRELRMDDATYRAMLVAVGKKSSTAEMDTSALNRVVMHLKASGFKVRSKAPAGGSGRSANRPQRRMADDPQSRKIRALWLFLHQLGQVKNPSEASLAAYCKRITRVDDLQFATYVHAQQLIETLKKWAMRVLPAKLAEAHGALTDGVLRYEISIEPEELAMLIGKLRDAIGSGTFDPMWWAWEKVIPLLRNTYPNDARFLEVTQ